MKFLKTPLQGVYILELEIIEDDRGFFARSFCQEEFTSHNLNPLIKQCNISYNKHKGTIRGMHYQRAPYQEAKVVSCIAGSIYDVIIDLRRDSSTYCRWYGIELKENEYRSLYIPEGFAHGFQTLEPDTLLHYQISEFYNPDFADGIRWNDQAFNIQWPVEITSISEKDKNYPDYIK